MIRAGIAYYGQKYMDEPVLDVNKPAGVAAPVANLFGRHVEPISKVVGHERVRLNWIKPPIERTFEEIRAGKAAAYARK